MSVVVPAASFADRLAQRRKQLVDRSSFELPVPGYEGLYARYRVLGYEDIRGIGIRNEQEATSQAEGERNTAAEVLVEACVGLLEKQAVDGEGRPTFRELGYRWTAAAARDLFGVGEIPSEALPLTAIKAVFPYPHDMLMMTHFQAYVEEADLGITGVDAIMEGESRASSVPTSSV